MGLVKAKCTNCGANLKVDNHTKTGICNHCGATFLTEDVIINNITNINYTENINGIDSNRQAVLEKLLTEYYNGNFNDIDNIKEYALKVQEFDLNNVLADFVVFENIESEISIKKLLSKKDLNISLQLFILLLNICGDDLNKDAIIKNIIKYKSQMDESVILIEIINKYRKKDISFVLNVIYNFKLNESENNKFLDELYNKEKANKIRFLSQLKLFASKHKDFTYDEEKFDKYAEHWKVLKEKQMLKRQQLIQEEQNMFKNQNVAKQTYNSKTIKKRRNVNKNKLLVWICVGVSLLFFIFFIIVINS